MKVLDNLKWIDAIVVPVWIGVTFLMFMELFTVNSAQAEMVNRYSLRIMILIASV